MAGNFFVDFFRVMPFFLLFVGVGIGSLALSLYPQLTVPAIVINLFLGAYYMFKGYSANTDNMEIDDLALNGFHIFIGWVLLLSAAGLGIKFVFIGYKALPIFGTLLLNKKNLNT